MIHSRVSLLAFVALFGSAAWFFADAATGTAGAASTATPPPGAIATPSPADAVKTATFTLSFLEPGGRIKLGEQTLELSLDAKPRDAKITLGGSLAGIHVRTLARAVRANGVPGVWCELTIEGAKDAELGYLAVTFPSEPTAAASAATKFKGAKGAPILAVLTRK